MIELREKNKIATGLVLLVLSCFLILNMTVPAFAQPYDSWMSWKEVPTDPGYAGTTDAALGAATFNDNLYVFMKGINTHVYYQKKYTSWLPMWTEVPTDPGYAGTTDAALGAAAFNNNLYVFMKGMNTHVYYQKLDASGNWLHRWTEVPTDPGLAGTTDAALGAAAFNNNLYVFMKGMNTHVYYQTLNASGNWLHRWTEVPTDPGLAGTTDAALAAGLYPGTNTLYVFMKGMDTRVYYQTLGANGNWDSRWREVPTTSSATTNVALAAAASYKPDQLYIFRKGYGQDQRIYYITLDRLMLH